jgi:hypothetical protein
MVDDVKQRFPSLNAVTALQRGKPRDHGGDLTAFEGYWASKAPDGDIPRRSQIDPRGIEAFLSNAFVAERIAPGLARLRIAGMHLSDVMGMEVRAMPLSCLIAPGDRDRFAEALVEVFDRPAKLQVTLEAEGGLGRPALTGQMLLLPLRSDLGDISRGLGCLVTRGPIGRTPRRFRITGLDLSPVLEHSGPAPITPHPSERPYLRVVK